MIKEIDDKFEKKKFDQANLRLELAYLSKIYSTIEDKTENNVINEYFSNSKSAKTIFLKKLNNYIVKKAEQQYNNKKSINDIVSGINLENNKNELYYLSKIYKETLDDNISFKTINEYFSLYDEAKTDYLVSLGNRILDIANQIYEIGCNKQIIMELLPKQFKEGEISNGR